MSQRTLIYGFGCGRSQDSLNLPFGRLACAETLFVMNTQYLPGGHA